MRVSIGMIEWLMSKFTFGALSSQHDDITFVVQRQPQTQAQRSSELPTAPAVAALHHS
jgi:hypothetical protein